MFLLRFVWPPLLLVGSLAAALADAAQTIYLAPDAYTPVSKALRDERAGEQYFLRAVEAAKQSDPATALRLVAQTLSLDPDHEAARQALGYVRHEGKWMTPIEAQRARRGEHWDSRYGWIAPSDLPRYEAGERRIGRRWVSAEVDDRLHSTIERGWQVRTDHFIVTTNHSLAAAAMLGAELEQLHQVWTQLFAEFWLTEREAAALLVDQRVPRATTKPMSVIYHRDKSSYVAALRAKQPRIAETLGIYFDDLRQSHFYAGEDQAPPDRATLYHEAVHQLFQEAVAAPRNVGADHGFWLVEGIASYFETLAPLDDPQQGRRFVIGDPQSGRLPVARHRLLTEAYYVPMAELSALGKDDLQRRTDLAPLYGQAAGMATYWMEGAPDGRRALVAHLRALYERRADQDDLPRRLGISTAEIDARYRAWVATLPEADSGSKVEAANSSGG